MLEQYHILHNAMNFDPATSLSLFGIGLLYNLQGFRFIRVLAALSATLIGFALGGVAAAMMSAPPLPMALGVGVTCGVLALLRLNFGVSLASVLTFCFYGLYMGQRLGFDDANMMMIGGVGLFIGMALAWGGSRSLPILVTTMQGAMIMLLGFVGIAKMLAPTFAETFVAWSSNALLVPLLVGMLVVLGYSVQANAQQGDIRAGTPGATDWKGRDAVA